MTATAAVQERRAQQHLPVEPGRLDPCSEEVRVTIVRLVAPELPARVAAALDDPDTGLRGAHREACLQPLIEAVITAVVKAGETGRVPRPPELAIFAVIGELAALRGIDDVDVVEVLDASAEAVRDDIVLRAHQLDDRFSTGAIDKATASLCGAVECISRLAYEALWSAASRVGSVS